MFKCPKCGRYVKGTKLDDYKQSGYCEKCDIRLTAEYRSFITDSGLMQTSIYVYNKKNRIYKMYTEME